MLIYFKGIGKLNLFKNKSSAAHQCATKCSVIPSVTYKNIPVLILMMKHILKDWLLIANEGFRFVLFCTEAQVPFTYDTTLSPLRYFLFISS